MLLCNIDSLDNKMTSLKTSVWVTRDNYIDNIYTVPKSYYSDFSKNNWTAIRNQAHLQFDIYLSRIYSHEYQPNKYYILHLYE